MKQTAKFCTFDEPHGKNQKQHYLKNLKTEQTEQFNKSYYNHSSIMKIDELELPKDQTVIINNKQSVNSHYLSSRNTYNCSICERLRLICPSKNYITQQFCQKCNGQVNLDFDETKGHAYQRKTNVSNNAQTKNYAEVNQVRFTQGNKVFPIKISQEKYRPPSPPHPSNFRNYTHQQIIKPIITQPLIAEEIIFYPVIHNKLVYVNLVNPQKPNESKSHSINNRNGRSRFISESAIRSRMHINQYLDSINDEKVLTPHEVKQLANSMRRITNPNNQDQQ